ncbi:thymidylate kinase [Acetobacter estunensis NRIC 0472]|uniref:Thymidylate kinase n=1 Tax=Acetobacter estunensis TaxID=104097 RepID=A0A967EGK8_9PROT|nr:dTMP kinase [Acetobacter estunensis]NHO52597.1 dTMP kinase [Acetobacter estunensis]GBQ22652.1 thymidylate kinase [Acetobacter estunensis NRIC 0472]
MSGTAARGAFITFEGGEGAGKSTQLRLVAARLREMGHAVVATREPGGSPGAEALRELLLFGKHDLSARAEIMTHFAARCDHVDRVIRPAIAAGQIVLCDRFFDSTMAYQGYGRGQGDAGLIGLIASLRGLIDLDPDLTVLFEVGLETGRRRIAARAAANTPAGAAATLDRYERADQEFHARVAQGFQAIAAHEPVRFARVSSESASVESVTARVVEIIETFLKGR